jgi:nitroreductase
MNQKIHSIDQMLQEQHAPIFNTIKQRRSVGQLTDQEPSRAQIERMLEAATYAPSHHVTEPWHFFVIMGAAREELGALMAASIRPTLKNLAPEKLQLRLWKERNKPLRTPVIITVAIKEIQDIEGMLVENIEAAAAATQNMLLAAEEMGLATLWRTGESAYDPLVKRWFGLDNDDHIVGFIYVGYPKVMRQMRTPTPFAEKTTWLS